VRKLLWTTNVCLSCSLPTMSETVSVAPLRWSGLLKVDVWRVEATYAYRGFLLLSLSALGDQVELEFGKPVMVKTQNHFVEVGSLIMG